jgi:acyl-ACP thioesterase
MFRAKEMTERLRIQPGYSSVDMLGHVNSTRYLEWICDCFSMDEHRCKTLEWVQINYSNEVLPGEQVSVAMGQQEGSPGLWLAEGSNLTTGMKAFEAAARWRG